MSKDHKPSDFGRSSGYKSDLEIAETGSKVKSINTSFGSKNHNAYIVRTDSSHEHFYYDPATQKSGWHGHNYETANNHPNQNQDNIEGKGESSMAKSNSFLEGIKVDQATIDRCNEVSRNVERSTNVQSTRNTTVDAGREHGDSGPGSLGRESAYKAADNTSSHEGVDSGHSSEGNGVSGHSASSEGTSGGHSAGGQGDGGQGSGEGHGSGEGQGGH